MFDYGTGGTLDRAQGAHARRRLKGGLSSSMPRSPSLAAAAALVLAHALNGLDYGRAQAQSAREAPTPPTGVLPLDGVAFGVVSGVAAKPVVDRFDVEAYDIDGNSLLEPLELEKSVYDFLGPGRTAADIDGARLALEEAYHRRGYDSVVVQVPAQTVADHVVRLQVVEAVVGRLRVTGSKYYSIEQVKQEAPALAEGAVPNFQLAQQEIAELNRVSGRQVTPLVQPGKAPGTVDIDLKVNETEPLHASVEVNNDHSADTTALRTTTSVRYDNLWQAGHTVSLSYAVAPQNRNESEVEAGSYLAPVPNSHLSLMLYGYNSNSNVATLGDVAVLGKGYAVGVRAINQLPSVGSISQTLTVGGDFKHFYQLISAGTAGTPPTESAVDYGALTTVYTLQTDSAASSSHATLGVTAGLRSAARDEAVFQVNRANSRSNFVHLNLDAEHTQNLPNDFVLDLRATAQVANTALLSGEQFSSGGLGSVRGYHQSAAVGDEGAFGSVELRGPAITLLPPRYLTNWRFYAFGDAGGAWLLKPLVDQKDSFSLYSAGLGARFQLLRRIDGNVLIGAPLTSVRGTDVARGYAQFSLKAGF